MGGSLIDIVGPFINKVVLTMGSILSATLCFLLSFFKSCRCFFCAICNVNLATLSVYNTHLNVLIQDKDHYFCKSHCCADHQ